MNVSNTDRNLWTAFIEEAVAERKYHAFAMRAPEEGYPRVAEVLVIGTVGAIVGYAIGVPVRNLFGVALPRT